MKIKILTSITVVITLSMSLITIAKADNIENSFVLKRIAKRGVINVGHRRSSVPFSYYNRQGKPEGYTLDICAKIIEEIKKVVGKPNLKIKYVPITAQTRIPLIANGTLDIECGTTTHNLTRRKQVDYLSTTFITGTKLAVPKRSRINRIEDMNGKVIALALGTTNEKAVKAIAREKRIKIKFVMVKGMAEGWASLTSGRVDAFAADSAKLYALIAKAKRKGRYKVVGRYLSFDPYGIMVPQGDSLFRRLGDAKLADMMRDGSLHRIYAKWFEPGPNNINMPLSDTLRTAFEVQAFSH